MKNSAIFLETYLQNEVKFEIKNYMGGNACRNYSWRLRYSQLLAA